MDHGCPTERRSFFEPSGNPGGTGLIHKQAENIWRVDYQLRAGDTEEQALREGTVRASDGAIGAGIGRDAEFDCGPSSGSASPNAQLAGAEYLLDHAGIGMTAILFCDGSPNTQAKLLLDELQVLDKHFVGLPIGGQGTASEAPAIPDG